MWTKNIIDMKRTVYILLMLVCLGGVLYISACDDDVDDVINEHYKNENTYYLHNESGQDVTVTFTPREGDAKGYTYTVPKGKVKEISDDAKWKVSVRYLEKDSVVFVFADGKRVVHSYINTSFGKDNEYSYIYEPAENNIFFTGYDIPSEESSWVIKSLGTMKFRHDYTIR